MGSAFVINPYESPKSHDSERPTKSDTVQRSSTHVMGLLVIAGLVAFVATPGLCAVAWLQGYGPGGMHELKSGYPIRGMIAGSIFFSPIHFLALMLPKQQKTRIIGYAVSGIVVGLMCFYWFILAAAIASV